MSNFKRQLYKALGTKDGVNDKESDNIALIRLFFVLQCMITNVFIVASCLKNLGVI